MSLALVRALLDDDPVLAMLDPGKQWRRIYGRQTAAAVLLVYEPEDDPRGAVAICISEDGRTISQSHWSADPALPSLAGLVASHPEVVPVRYRPGKRCTLRKGELFLKCVADDRGDIINRNARALYAAAQMGQLGFGVARPAGWLAGARIIVQHRLPGAPIIDQLWSPDGAALAARLGQANASLVKAPLTPGERFTYAHQMKRTAKYVRRLQQYLPQCADIADVLLRKLAWIAPGNADRPTHGAPHAHQWLDGPDGLMLVDFDRYGLGDPEVEVATFLAEADFESSHFALAAGEGFRAGFEAEYPLNPRLLGAYRVHKHIAKALRTATALRVDAAERALAILSQADQYL
jgi:Phosphotransferase enzyme family